MKIGFNKLVICFFLILLIASCTETPKYINVNFTAKIPYYSIKGMIKTKVIQTENKFPFGIIACIDDQFDRFVVIADVHTSYYEDHITVINDLNLNMSSLIKYDKLNELIEIINSSLESWDKKQKETENLFFEFYIAPEHKIKRISKNIIYLEGTFKYVFQNSAKGSLFVMILGEKKPIRFESTDIEKLQFFKKVLQKSKAYLDSFEKNNIENELRESKL